MLPSLCLMSVLATGTANPPDARAKSLLHSENYRVKWGEVAKFDAAAELEIGDGDGHGFTLNWTRFKPGKDGVDVLSIQLDEGPKPYKSKWPPDDCTVIVKSARMKAEVYESLLRGLAVVNSATLTRVEKRELITSSQDFWVQVRLTAGGKMPLDLNWVGYWGEPDEWVFAKPKAAVALAEAAVESLDFKKSKLTGDERTWASGKFARDWKAMKDEEFAWWVRERYLLLIGEVGDASALPALREVLSGKPESEHDRIPYHAINAATRLLGKDVREKPVEEMDVEKTRKKVLELLKDVK